MQMTMSVVALSLLLLFNAAHAQSSVNIYGIVDAYVGSVKNTGGTQPQGRTMVVNAGGMQTSFIGFRGSEDLGGGASAVFSLETFVRLDTGAIGRNDTDPFWGRTAVVGLESAQLGRVTFGRNVSPYSLATTTYFSPFAGSTGFGTAFAHTLKTNIQGDTRLNNSARFTTPSTSKVVLDVLYSLGQEIDDGPNRHRDRAVDGIVRYIGDGWGAVAGMRRINLNNANNGRDQSAYMLGAMYDFRVVKVFAQAHRTKDGQGNAALAVAWRTYELGLSVPVGPGEIWATMARSTISDSSPTTSDQRVSWALAFDYPLSKRTDAYVAAFSDKQRNPRIDQSVLAVGMRHRF